MTTVITHQGPSHRDEFLSCCLLIAAGKADRVERRDVTDEDLDNPEVIVLDQGGVHDPAMLNFDHHQFSRDADPACSITLILPLLGIDPEQAREIWTWLEFSELLDSKGPFETAKRLGSNPDALFAGISPIETTVLRWFEEMKTLSSEHCEALWGLMYRIGEEKLNYLTQVIKRIDYLHQHAKVVVINGLRFVDATCIDRTDNPVLGLEMYAHKRVSKNMAAQYDQTLELGEIAGTVTQDDRGDGLTLFRRKDHPRVDFSRLEGMNGVVFAHKGGFVAKLEAGVDPLPMLKAAIVPKGDPPNPVKVRLVPDELRPKNEPKVDLLERGKTLVLQRTQHVIDVRVVCNSEPIPGWGHDPQDMVDAAARAAAQVLGSYDPVVIGSEVKDLKVDELSASETAAIVRHMTTEKKS